MYNSIGLGWNLDSLDRAEELARLYPEKYRVETPGLTPVFSFASEGVREYRKIKRWVISGKGSFPEQERVYA